MTVKILLAPARLVKLTVNVVAINRCAAVNNHGFNFLECRRGAPLSYRPGASTRSGLETESDLMQYQLICCRVY